MEKVGKIAKAIGLALWAAICWMVKAAWAATKFVLKAIYFVWRWFWYIVFIPFGVFSLFKRHSKKNREKTLKGIEEILDNRA